MKILFCCPILDIRYEWFMGFTEIWEQLRKYEVEKFIPYRKPVQIADTMMARKAIEGNFDYVLRMDDDVWDVPKDAVKKMLQADKDFISAVMCANSFPYQRCAFVKHNKSESLIDIARKELGGLGEVYGEGVVPVDLSAFPFTLIRTSVFKRMPEPWFEYTEGVPSDSYFCQKMLDNGIQPYVDMSLQVTHREITFWNRKQKFLSEFEAGIATGTYNEKHKLYKVYLELVDNIVEKYSKKKLFVL